MPFQFYLPFSNPNPLEALDNVSSQWPQLDNGSFQNNVKIKEWANFDSRVVQARIRTDAFNSQIKNQIRGYLHSARDLIQVEQIITEAHLTSWMMTPIHLAVGVAVAHTPESIVPDVKTEPQASLKSQRYETMLSPDSRSNRQISNHFNWIPDYASYLRNDDMETKYPLGSVELKPPRARLVPDAYRNRSASRIAKWFDDMFKLEPATELAEVAGMKPIVARFAQAILQATMTRGGCGMVTNYVNAMFFHIEGLIRHRVVIRVSKLYQCDLEPSTLHATVAWVQQAQKLDKLDSTSAARKQRVVDMFDCFDHLSS